MVLITKIVWRGNVGTRHFGARQSTLECLSIPASRFPAVFPPICSRESSDSNSFPPTPPNSSRLEYDFSMSAGILEDPSRNTAGAPAGWSARPITGQEHRNVMQKMPDPVTPIFISIMVQRGQTVDTSPRFLLNACVARCGFRY